MRTSYVIAVLESFDVVRKQLILLSNALPKYNDDFELILVDDGSEPTLINKIFDFEGECFDSLSIVREEYNAKWASDIYTIEGLGFPFRVIETYDKRPWTQPRGRNMGADLAYGEWLLMTDIDHIIAEEGLADAYAFNGDKMTFRRKYAILLEEGDINYVDKLIEEVEKDFDEIHSSKVPNETKSEEDILLSYNEKEYLLRELAEIKEDLKKDKIKVIRNHYILEDYGCKHKDLEAGGNHANTFIMKKSIFCDLLNGYDLKFCGKHGGDDTNLNDRYGKLFYNGKQVERHSVAKNLIYVYPDPNKDVKRVFHKLRRK